MTSETPPPSTPPPDDLAGHPDLDTLADLDAGLLDPPAAARAGPHVAACTRCSATLAAFAAVRVDLRSLPPPVLPPAVAARLDETLAQLRRDRPDAARLPPTPAVNAHQARPPDVAGAAPPPGSVGAGVAPRRAPVVDLAAAQEQRRARARRLTSRVAASVVVAAALVGVGAAIVQKTDSNSTVSQGAALPGDQSAPGGSRSGQGAAGDSAEGRQTPAVAPPKTLPSYTAGTLLAAIPGIAARSAVDIITSAGLDGPAGPMADAALRARCTAGITNVSGVPIAVQRVLFDDRAAYVFVFAGTDGSRSVIVVSADCGSVAVPQVLFRHQG
jgi:hypothetical protein